ncbi:MAG: phosphopyruvate hydratase [bacterium]|nr:phosphopyruvate hydratase [bacterium]
MSAIKKISARQVLDSKGQPTVQVILETDSGRFSASVPSGISTGKYEAWELRDKDGGVKRACQNIEKIIAPVLKGEDPCQQDEIDSMMVELDGTNQKKRLGANAILAVSMAVCRAGAKAKKMFLWQHLADLADNRKLKLPQPCFLLFEGGKHGDGVISTQEFMVVIKKGTIAEKMALMDKIFAMAKRDLNGKVGIGKEGAFVTILSSTAAVLETMDHIITRFPGKGLGIIIDSAASHFKKGEKYFFEGIKYDQTGLLRFYKSIINKYPILAIEDPFSENDWQGFRKITKVFGKKTIIIGDDLLATNLNLARRAVEEKSCNAMVIKPNQIGTVTETIGVANYAKKQGLKIFAKHRGGETTDDFLADLAVGLGADYIATGGFFQKERVVKYQRLLQIEKELSLNNEQ